MKKIGVIGGAGPQATAVLYMDMIKLSQEKFGVKENHDYPFITIESIPVPDIISDRGREDEAIEMLINACKNLEKAGATKIGMACNTIHLYLDKLQAAVSIEIMSMIELVAKKVQELGYDKVGLVGSSTTLSSDLYQGVLKKYNIEVALPDEKDREVIDKVIRGVISGKEDSKVLDKYREILEGLLKGGAQGVVLGCTELPLAIDYKSYGNKALSSLHLLSEGLVSYYYSK